jgi:P2 family phage contractile tail tube protein
MIPQTLVNMNLFVDGKGFAGQVTTITLPKVKRKSDEYRAGGMDGPIKMGMGMEVMEASFSLSGMPTDALIFFGLADDTAFNGNFRGAFKDQKGAVVPVVATFRGMLEEIDMGDWKPGEKSETKYNIAPSYYKLEVDSQVIYELDPVNNVRTINGKDETADERTAIGM